MNTRFVYVRDTNGFPVACAAILDDGGTTPCVGVSIHNPEDKFDRSKARHIALGRAKALSDGDRDCVGYAFVAKTKLEPGTSFVADVYQEILSSWLTADVGSWDAPLLPTRVTRSLRGYLSR